MPRKAVAHKTSKCYLAQVWLISILLFSDLWVLIYLIGAVDVKLTEEEKKELEAPYIAQLEAAFGHS